MKRTVYIILLTLLIVLVAVFISQNSASITIRFFSWDVDSYSGLVILFSFLLGVLVMSIVWAFTAIYQRQKKSRELHGEKKESGTNEPDSNRPAQDKAPA